MTYRPEPVESVTLTYEDAIVVLMPSSMPLGYVSWGEPEAVERDGRTYWFSQRQVVFTEGDTIIHLSQTMATGDLIALAETLVPLA